MKLVACPACSEARSHVVFRDGESSFTLLRCAASRCGLVYNRVEAQVSSTAMEYSERHLTPERSARIRAVTADFRDEIRGRLSSGCVVDVGSGTGEFLDALGPSFERIGIEPDPFGCNYARRRYGIDARVGFYQSASLAPESVDVLVTSQVMEHVDDPRSFLDAAYLHLRPGGLLIVDVPSFRNPRVLLWHVLRLPQLVRRDFIRSHLIYYTPTTLARLVRDAGFSIERVVTGRYAVKFSHPVLRAVDSIANRLRIGGIVVYAAKPPIADGQPGVASSPERYALDEAGL